MGLVPMLVLASCVALALPASAADRAPGHSPDEAGRRVEHHLREADQVARQFEAVLARPCERFATAGEWQEYLDSLLTRAVSLVAHLEEAWREARLTDDDAVRRAAKAPRRQVDRVRQLAAKLEACAADHGVSLDAADVWRRVELEVQRRRAEIALPR